VYVLIYYVVSRLRSLFVNFYYNLFWILKNVA
jgi:hypothetical protein